MKKMMVKKKKDKDINRKLSTILGIPAVVIIAVTAIAWIGIMDINKK